MGLAGPSGSGKTAFSEKIQNFIPGCAILSMDNYNDGSKVIDGNFDGARRGEGRRAQRKGVESFRRGPYQSGALRGHSTQVEGWRRHPLWFPRRAAPCRLPANSESVGPDLSAELPAQPGPCPPADPRITDYDTLLANIQDLKEGRPTEVGQAACLWQRRWQRSRRRRRRRGSRAATEPQAVLRHQRPRNVQSGRCDGRGTLTRFPPNALVGEGGRARLAP